MEYYSMHYGDGSEDEQLPVVQAVSVRWASVRGYVYVTTEDGLEHGPELLVQIGKKYQARINLKKVHERLDNFALVQFSPSNIKDSPEPGKK